MPRSNRPRRASSGGRKTTRKSDQPAQDLDIDRLLRGGAHLESGRDGEWQVRSVIGSPKTYICPGCQQNIVPGVGHTVAWNAESWFGDDHALSDRRHWHNSCWRARATRRPQ